MPNDAGAAQTETTRPPIALPRNGPSLYEQVYDSILEAICGGALRPGDRINQDELAARLDVSRQPVTQALTVLKTQGFVRDAGRRGLEVAPLDKGFFAALYQLREALDPMAARLAARRSATLSAPAGRRLLAQGRAALEQGSTAALTRADMEFHVWIYEAAANPLLTDMLRLYWHHLRRAMLAVVGPEHDRSLVWEQHAAILEAVLDGNDSLAERLSLQHIRGAAERVMQTFPG